MAGGSRALKRILVAALILGCGAAATGQSAPPSVPPIPVYEQFVHGSNLRIRLMMRSTSLTVFDEPGFTAIFENTGSAPLYLNPEVVSNVRVFDERGNLMQPPCVSISEPAGPAAIGRTDLVRLPAGGTWVEPLRPAFVSGPPESVWTYWGCGRQGEQERLLLPRGSYTARFTYVSYAGYAAGYIPGHAAGYDLRESADVWEGRLESEPLAFSVAGASEVAPEPWPGIRLADGATDEPWPHMAGDFTIDCRTLQPAWWFSDDPVFAVGRCGTADDFRQLRPMLDSSDQDVRIVAESALAMLTFVGENGGPELASPATSAGWDAWYREHRDESRAEWAARRLRDTVSYPLQREAAEYLGQLNDRRWLPLLRDAAAAHPSAWARIAAARAVADFDRPQAVAFLTRELNHRDLWICVRALEALNTLTGQSLVFDFRIPSERQQALAAFAATR